MASTTSVITARGIDVDVLTFGPAHGEPVVFLHGFSGHLGDEPTLAALGDAGFHVCAPVWPGYGSQPGEGQIDDMLDFALHGNDVVAALRLEDRPHLIGHSMGGMIAAEMAAVSPASYQSLVLAAPLGLWLDEHPIPDIYTKLPFEFAPLLFHDEALGTRLLAGGRGVDFADRDAIQQFLVTNSRRLGTAGKILFPIPNRGLRKRLYRITNPTLLLWGDHDQLLAPPYRQAWSDALPEARTSVIAEAGHMLLHDQPISAATAIATFLA